MARKQLPARLNVQRKRGDDFAWSVALTAGDDGDALNLTGWSVELTVVTIPNPPDASTVLFTETATITDAAGGLIDVPISLANSDQEPAEYFYDLQGIDAAGKIRTLVEGAWVVLQDRAKHTTP